MLKTTAEVIAQIEHNLDRAISERCPNRAFDAKEGIGDIKKIIQKLEAENRSLQRKIKNLKVKQNG